MPSQPHLDINPVEVLRVYVERLADVGGSGGNILFPALISRRKKLFTLGRPASYTRVYCISSELLLRLPRSRVLPRIMVCILSGEGL